MEDTKLNIEKLAENYKHFSTDVENFLTKGNKSAATRARKALLEISKLCKDIRKQIQEIKNSGGA